MIKIKTKKITIIKNIVYVDDSHILGQTCDC